MSFFKMHSAFAAGICAIGLLAASPASAVPSACDAVAGNLIQNCGFESGITDWGTINAAIGSNQGPSIDPHSGRLAWQFGATFPVPPNWDVIYQVFATHPGDTYKVSYFEQSDGGTPSLFFAGFETTPGVNPISSDVFVNPPAGGYTNSAFTFVANKPFSLIYFGGWDVPGFQTLDDVVVTRTPEPLTLSLVGAGLAGAVAMRRRKKKSA